jgi:hypothetical protein
MSVPQRRKESMNDETRTPGRSTATQMSYQHRMGHGRHLVVLQSQLVWLDLLQPLSPQHSQ